MPRSLARPGYAARLPAGFLHIRTGFASDSLDPWHIAQKGGLDVSEPPTATFAGLLRRLRADAGLTQEELAEAASLSARSVSDLERGVASTARKETARLLADALKLTGTARGEFEAAARGRAVGRFPAQGLQISGLA